MITASYPRMRPHVTDLRGVRMGLLAASLTSIAMWAAIFIIT